MLQAKPVAAATVAPTAKQEAAAAVAALSPEGQAIIAVIDRRFQSFRGRGQAQGQGQGQTRGGGGGRGRGGRGGGQQQDGGGRQKASPETLKAREKAKCGRCNQMVKHRTPECFVNLEKMAQRNQDGGQGQRRQGNADAVAMQDGGGQFADFNIFESLN
jgi:hypothetical protein